MTILEFRKGKPKPQEIYWYTGWIDKDGRESDVSMTHPVAVVSFPVPPELQDAVIGQERFKGSATIFVQHTPGDPCTACWVKLSELGEQIVNPQPPRG